MKLLIQLIYFILGMVICNIFTQSYARSFKIVSYNVENLFDLKKDATDYPEYIPNSKFGTPSNRGFGRCISST